MSVVTTMPVEPSAAPTETIVIQAAAVADHETHGWQTRLLPFRERDLLEITDPPGVDAVKRKESILGKSVADIDADFVNWFQRLHG